MILTEKNTKNNLGAILTLLVCCVLFIGIIFTKQGIHNIYNDTTVYVNQILFFNGDLLNTASIQYHFFKPLYGLLGSLLYPTLSAYSAILSINILFYFGLALGVFFLLKKLRFQEEYALIGALWVISGYPLLKYGLALLTDISGWFFTVMSLCVFLIAREKKYPSSLLIITSIIGFLGSLSKETGVLGLLACGTFLFLSIFTEKNIQHIKHLLLLALPAILLQIALIVTTLQYSNKTIFDWISFNISTNTTEEFHSLYYFIFTELATFHILWVYALIGVWYAFSKKLFNIKAENVLFGLSLFVATIPVLFWPLFYIRIFYIQFLFIIPFGLLGLIYIQKKHTSTLIKYFLIFLPILISVILHFIAGNSSLFDLLSQLTTLLK